MILRVSSSGFCLALATAGLSGVLVCSPRAGGQERGRPIEFSRPKSTEVSTNLHQLGTKRDGLRQLQDDLLQPFGAFGPKSSLDGVLAPASAVPTPAAPPILSKRAKELQERRKNLIFMSPEDLVPGLSPEEIFKMPQYDKNGQERKKLSPLEQYYERLDHSGDAAATQNPRKEGQTFDARKSPDQRKNSESQDDALTHQPGGLKEGEQTLKGIVETELSSGAFGPSLTPVSASARTPPLLRRQKNRKPTRPSSISCTACRCRLIPEPAPVRLTRLAALLIHRATRLTRPAAWMASPIGVCATASMLSRAL